MFPLHWLVAAILASIPADGGNTSCLGAVYLDVRLALRAVALRGELLDARELRYVLTEPEYLPADLKLLGRRCLELADAPPLCDNTRFPEPAAIDELILFNRAYRQYLEQRCAIDTPHQEEWRAAAEETDHLYGMWDLIRDARSSSWPVPQRRAALKRLRELLGAEAYDSGCLPPPVPLRRFQFSD
jgi:hypothetical protein